MCYSLLCVDPSGVVFYVYNANATTFTTWFDDNVLVIFEVVKC